MPVEYVYKITVDDSDLQVTLKNIDTSLSSLATRTAASFDKVGTSMGQGIKKASTEAKKAVSDLDKAQKSAASTASKTEKAYIRLLTAELKLAAAGDKLTQEFIANAAAGAQSGDALASLVTASTSLTDAQVKEAVVVASLRAQITELSAAMGQEGADTAALTQQIAGLQGQLSSIAATREAERAATEASANAKRAEAEATAAATAAMAKAQGDAAAVSERTEKSYIKLLSAELKLAAGSDEAAQAFIKQATAGAQSADALAMVVTQSTSLTQAQVQQAQTIAFLNNQIQTLTAALGEEGADTEALTGRISEYQSMLERIIHTRQEEKAASDANIAAKKAESEAIAKAASEAAKAQVDAEKTAAKAQADAEKTAADAASTAADAQSKAAAEADKAEIAKKKLLETELKLAAGTDKAAKDTIALTAAGAQNREVLLQAVMATGALSDAQVNAADRITQLRTAITETTAAMGEEGANTEYLSGRLEHLNYMLSVATEERERAIQATREIAQAEKEAGDAVDKSAGEIDDSLGEVTEEAERNEQAFIKLLAAQLKLAAGADQSSQALIKNAAATAQTGDALLAAVSVTDHLSQAQVDHAVKVATLEESIQSLTAELDKEGANVEELTGQIAAANGELERMEALKEEAAAAAQAHASGLEAEKAAMEAQRAASADSQKEQAKAAKDNAIVQRKANREFTKLSKSFPEIKQALVELTGQYGTFKTVVGGTGQATGRAQEELHKLFKDNPAYARELDRLTKKYGKFTATVQRADFGPRMKSSGQQVRQLGFALQRMGIQGVAAFGEIFAALGPLGLAIGAIIVPIIAVSKALKKLADTAVREFKKITKEAFEAGRAFETTEAAFKAIFAGADPGVVEAALHSARMESERLGVTLEEILPKILPKVGSLEDAYKIAELIPGLAASAVDLGPSDALRSIIEALAGDLVSLRKAFEIPVGGIRAAQEEFGLVQGLIIGLNEELENMGLTFADQAETINIKIGQMQQRWQTFKQLMGEPLVDAVKEQFDDFFTLLDDEEDTLHGIATMIGEIIAQVGTEIGGNLFELLEKIDPQDIEKVANSLGRIANEVVIFAEDMTGFFQDTESIADFVSGIADWTEKTRDQVAVMKELGGVAKAITNPIKTLWEAIRDMLGGIRVGYVTIETIMDHVFDLGEAMDSLRMIIGIVKASFMGFLGTVGGFLSGIFDLIDGSKTFDEVANAAFKQGSEAARDSIDETARSMREWTDVTIDGSKATRDFGADALATADDILAMELALNRLTDSEDDFIEKQEEINEKIAEFARNAETKFQSMLTDLGRDLLDAHIANQRKLVDIQTKSLQEIDDIKRQHDNDIIAAAQSLSDRETDILKKHGLEMTEIEKDLNKERLKIEQDYLDDLERMRAKFDFDMFEAFLANDAKRLAQLRRRQAFEEKEAEKDRDRNLRDADGKADEEREARQSTLEQELQDARIANARTIRDLLTNLELQFQEQEISRKRDVESQALANKRKEEDMRDSFDRQILDYDDWWKEQHRRTVEGIGKDLEEMQGWAEKREEIMRDIAQVGEIFTKIPIEELREQTFQRAYSQEMIQGGGQLPAGFPETLTATLAAMSREELEGLFDEASEFLGQFSLQQERALRILNLQTEVNGFVTPQQQLENQELIAGMSPEKLTELIVELAAELAGIEIPPPLPEGYVIAPGDVFGQGVGPGVVATAGGTTAIPEGFSFPVVSAPQEQQSGFYGAGGGFGAPAASGAIPGYGFPPVLPPDMAQFENYFLPGNMMPIPPTYGFDAQAYFDSLDEETEAQAQAELEKRGEMHDTVDLSALLAEQSAALHSTYMQDEVDQTQIASDAQIAILENTLAAQREVLAAVRDDPTLQVDIDALEVSIGALEDLIARARDQQAEMAAQTAQQEAEAILAAEGLKRDEIEETAATAEDAWLRRKLAADTGLYGEIQASQDAKKEQVDLVEQRLLEQGQMTGDFRTQEYELQTEADEGLRELFTESGDDMLDMQYGWWRNLLDAQVQGINSDLNLMVRWLEERQRIWDQMQLTMPGGDLPSLPGDPEGTSGDDDGDATAGATLEQLQSLAMGFAQQLGYEMGVWREHIYSLNYDDLLALVYELQDLVGAAGYALGGGFLPGKKLLVGDRGPEIVEFPHVGTITPLSAFMERPPSMLPDPGSTMNDYSINMKNEFPDPRGLSPSVKAEMENISANIALKIMGGRRGGRRQ